MGTTYSLIGPYANNRKQKNEEPDYSRRYNLIGRFDEVHPSDVPQAVFRDIMDVRNWCARDLKIPPPVKVRFFIPADDKNGWRLRWRERRIGDVFFNAPKDIRGWFAHKYPDTIWLFWNMDPEEARRATAHEMWHLFELFCVKRGEKMPSDEASESAARQYERHVCKFFSRQKATP